ncbi:unknown_gene_1988 [Phodopus roborovskii]|uniref:Unknown_gene_1988 protein n=1 Tax=Phodopus roborovskii TaxID=109678 RepID=A0AAU9Z7J5_PHORO|nr:unknown_gene_1988 [Phodopus roborovskii]
MPTTEVKDSPQSEAIKKAEGRSSKSERVSSEKKSKKRDHKEIKRPLRVFRDSHCSGTREEKGKDITKGRVLDLSVEVVIEVSSEEEQKGDDDDNNGTARQQHLEEETKQPVGKRNQRNPSNKTSIFQKEVEDSLEDSEGVATEQPLGKDDEAKSQKDEDSNEVTEEEAGKQQIGNSNKGSHCQRTNNGNFISKQIITLTNSNHRDNSTNDDKFADRHENCFMLKHY